MHTFRKVCMKLLSNNIMIDFEPTPSPKRKLNVFYIIDTSRSMEGLKIECVNKIMSDIIALFADINNSNQDKNINSNEFKVKVNVDVLNIRSGVGTSCKIVGQIKDRGVYTIVEKQGSWGKLKSGAGWISLNYCKEV